MAAKQILSLVVASTWVVNLLIDNQIKSQRHMPLALFWFRLIGQKVCVKTLITLDIY